MSPTLSDLHQQFCHYSTVFKGNTPKTIAWLKHAIRCYQGHTQIDSIDQVSRQNVQDWLQTGSLVKNWNQRSIRGKMTALSLFFKWCVQNEFLESNPLDGIDRPKLPLQLPKSLSQEKVIRLLECTRTFRYQNSLERARAIAVMNLLVHTGIRKKELLNLQLDDINLQNSSLLVRAGKGQKDRIIPLTEKLVLILNAYLHERNKSAFLCQSFFTSSRLDAPLNESAFNRLVAKLREKSGINFSAHKLRHTFATLMLEGGCNIYSLSRMLGHSDIKTTTIYLSVSMKHLKEEIVKHPLNF